MRKFLSLQTVEDNTIDAILAVGGTRLDDEASVSFGDASVIISVPVSHRAYRVIKGMVAKSFLYFETSFAIYIPLAKTSVNDSKLLDLLEAKLPLIDVCFERPSSADTGSDLGTWQCPTRDIEPKTRPFEMLAILDAADVGLVEALYGHQNLRDFSFSLEGVMRQSKKGDMLEVAPPCWVDRVLRDPDTDQVFIAINLLNRSGDQYRVVSDVVSNSTMQDSRRLTEFVLDNTTSVVDRKGLGDLMKDVLRCAYGRLPEQAWIRKEDWLHGIDGQVVACVVGNKLLSRSASDCKRYHVDVKNPKMVSRGTLESWNSAVLEPASKSYLTLGALQLGLGAMMVDLLPGVASATFNFYGEAGLGKTLLLSAVASLFGNTSAPGQSKADRTGRPMIETFGSTSLALQAKGQQSGLCPLLIDEIGSNSFGQLDSYIYQLANGSARTRCDSSGQTIEMQAKTLFAMTSGEVPIVSCLSRNAASGVLDRAIDVHVGGAGLSFEGDDNECLRLFPGDEVRSDLRAGIVNHYGTVAPEFVRVLLSRMSSNAWAAELDALEQRLADNLPAYVSRGGSRRVLRRCSATINLAGALTHHICY